MDKGAASDTPLAEERQSLLGSIAMGARQNYPWKDALLEGYPAAGFLALAGYLLWTLAVSR